MSSKMPSMSEPTRAWAFYIDDMIAFAEKVVHYTRGMDQVAFETSPLHQDAYLGIDPDTVWSIIRDDVPSLLARLHDMKAHIARSSRQ